MAKKAASRRKTRAVDKSNAPFQGRAVSRPATPEKVREALSKPSISPDELLALRIVPAGRNGIYEACRRYLESPDEPGGIACFRVNTRIAIITAPLRQLLQIEAA